MATLQRFKFLTTQCGVEQSPTRSPSPSTSPLVQLRRKKTTLLMLLSLRSPSRREQPLINHQKDVAGRKLRDLFVSSSTSVEEEEEEDDKERKKGKTKEEVLAAMAAKLNAASSLQLESESAPAWFGFSKRLLRRAWRPKLVTIPE